MRFLSIVSVLFFILSSPFAYGEVKQKNFTKEEIKKMVETKAVIETKFGNMEIRFFPEVAPNHVNNYRAQKKVLTTHLPQVIPVL
jgi:peptidyl-prolyl cis-trans isomerase B (cyclophilin B)